MPDLLTGLREHDLPPFWDGFAVDWAHWRTVPTEQAERVFLCPPPRDPASCSACGVIDAGFQFALGQMATRKHISHDDIAEHERRQAAGEISYDVNVALPIFEVYRCLHCSHDTVYDRQRSEWWDLDHTDYGPEGSRCAF